MVPCARQRRAPQHLAKEAEAARTTSTTAKMSEGGAEFYSAQLLLAKSAKGAAAASLIGQVLEHPSVYVFGELLDVENVKALAGTAQSASLELLKCFAYGTWKDYRAAAGALPALSAGQAAKLKKLSVVTLASRAKTIAYAALMRELEMSNVREVEDLIIECFNGELLQGKIDQRAQQLEVHSCIGRDVRLDEVGGMAATLGQWHATAGALLGSLREKLEFYKAQVDAAKENQAQLDAKVEAVKATVRAQHEAGELHDDTMMDFDDGEDKARKSGRKSKHAMGARKL